MRFGIDLGGTKIEILALDGSREVLRERVATPQSNYDHIVVAIADLVAEAERKIGRRGTVGIAIPGTISTRTGLVKNANSTKLIGHPLDKDVAKAIGRAVRVANDANCFTLSEASDGAGAGKDVVFGVIVGTGCGGGVSVGGRVLNGAHGITGEWGHNPLPAPTREELRLAPDCYCGRASCIEAWISGTGLANDFKRRAGRDLKGHEIDLAARSGDALAKAVMEDFYDRFARSLAGIVNVLDPNAIVLGGGLSNIDSIYRELPARVERYSFFPEGPPAILKNVHGDSSGVRGAAWLWTEDEAARVK
ncbi:MAG: ROK family protein [Alphaproteobacteria bacterium]|nr:ROK family protein [Alphaproteobacteria bacterium]MBL6939580.1 ROK family protein [Alphaproteobacteria bacterium]MBL7100047.1 ROK family protein [Alphaproteobacteria bacterium]